MRTSSARLAAIFSPMVMVVCLGAGRNTIQSSGPSSGTAEQTAAAPTSNRAAGTMVSVTLSTHDQSHLLEAQPAIYFRTRSREAGSSTVVVDATQTYQIVDGFGAAFTDSAAYLLNRVADKRQLAAAMSDLFTRNGTGIGLSFMRTPIAASDIARSVYSYDDQPVGTTDMSLAGFSIAHDRADVLPIILEARRLNPQMKLLASPWSPPGWMKDPGSMSPVSMLGGKLLMTRANEAAFANYLLRYLQAYQAAGIPIDYLTLQNEPLNVTTAYPSMGMSPDAQLALLQGYVLPALKAANVATKVLVYDHNWDKPDDPESILKRLDAQQRMQVAGTAWHGYGGTAGVQQETANLFPDSGNWMTELSGGTWVKDQFTSDLLGITQVLRNAGKSYVKWSLALDQNLGPDLTQNAGLGGCNTCTPLVTVNSRTGAVSYDIEYYTLGQFSRFVLPGAVRIYSSNTPSVATSAFLNPDGSIALVAFNDSGSSQRLNVQWGGMQAFAYTLPALGAATFTWTGKQEGQSRIAATAQIQGSSYSAQSGLATEDTSDLTGEYDLGYISSGAWVRYPNVDFGAAGAISKVRVRTASGGDGGTVRFYLDSMTGAPIATVPLPVTGGWQKWQTVSSSVGHVSGVHTVYMVFSGGDTTQNLANLNWFQFQ